MADKPTKNQPDHFQVRMPAGMREKIRAQAENTGRSMNAEIVHLITQAMSSRNDDTEALEVITELRKMQRNLVAFAEEMSAERDRFIQKYEEAQHTILQYEREIRRTEDEQERSKQVRAQQQPAPEA
ncbi:MAG: Arc family DNA-binding protein [Pseudomonadota bacterium]